MFDTQFIIIIGAVVVCTITILVAMLFMTNNLKHIEDLLKNKDDESTCQGTLVTDRVYIYNAHEALVQATEKTKITKAELNEAIEEAIGWLGQALED